MHKFKSWASDVCTIAGALVLAYAIICNAPAAMETVFEQDKKWIIF